MTSSSSPAVLADQLKAIRDRELIPTPDEQLTDYAILTRCIEALGSSPKTAIPAPADGQVASQREAVAWRVWSAEGEGGLFYFEDVARAIAGETSHVQALYTSPADNLVGRSNWSAARNIFVRHADPFVKATRYEEASAIADLAAREFEALCASPADQSSDVSGLVEALRAIVSDFDAYKANGTEYDAGFEAGLAAASYRADKALEALAQAKRDGGKG